VGAEPDTGDADPAGGAPVAEPIVDTRAAAGGEPAAVVAVFAGDAGDRGATPGCAACDEADFGACVDALEATDVVFEDEVGAEAGLRAAGAAAAAEAGVVAGAAERVGGSGASPDPRSEASIIGDAHVPEYAASEGADAHDSDVEVLVEAPELAEPSDARLDVFVAAGVAPWPDFAGGAAGIPNPAGDFCFSVAAAALEGA
jgi:hypothetical protein